MGAGLLEVYMLSLHSFHSCFGHLLFPHRIDKILDTIPHQVKSLQEDACHILLLGTMDGGGKEDLKVIYLLPYNGEFGFR